MIRHLTCPSSFVFTGQLVCCVSSVISSFVFTCHLTCRFTCRIVCCVSSVISSFIFTGHFIIYFHLSFHHLFSPVISSFIFTCHFIICFHRSIGLLCFIIYLHLCCFHPSSHMSFHLSFIPPTIHYTSLFIRDLSKVLKSC